MTPTKSTSWFTRFAKLTSRVTGTPAAFALALGVVIVWAATGPVFGYSDTWQLIINTGTTIATFLMVYEKLAERARERLAGGKTDTGTPRLSRRKKA